MTQEKGRPSDPGTRRFLLVLAAGILLLLAAAAVNVAVDPYLIYHSPRIEGFNRWKVKFFFGQYESKPRLVRARHPGIVMLGTSTANCFRPDHPAFHGTEAFNYALAGSAPYVHSAALAHALERGTVRSVIVGVDLFAYNAFLDQRAYHDFVASVEPGSGLEVHWRRLRRELEILFARAMDPEALSDSAITVQGQDQPGVGGQFRDMHEDGFWNNPRPPEVPQITLFTMIENKYLGEGWFPSPARRFALDNGRGRSTLAELAGILERARVAGLDVRVAIMPTHARYAEAIRAAGLWDQFDELKRGVLAVALGSGAEVQVWDFSGYHSLNMGLVRGATADDPWFEDSIHPKAATGDLMIWRMFDPAGAPELPADFGRRLEPGTLDASLAAAVARRDEYLASRPVDVKHVQTIAQRVRERRAGGG